MYIFRLIFSYGYNSLYHCNQNQIQIDDFPEGIVSEQEEQSVQTEQKNWVADMSSIILFLNINPEEGRVLRGIDTIQLVLVTLEFSSLACPCSIATT